MCMPLPRFECKTPVSHGYYVVILLKHEFASGANSNPENQNFRKLKCPCERLEIQGKTNEVECKTKLSHSKADANRCNHTLCGVVPITHRYPYSNGTTKNPRIGHKPSRELHSYEIGFDTEDVRYEIRLKFKVRHA